MKFFRTLVALAFMYAFVSLGVNWGSYRMQSDVIEREGGFPAVLEPNDETLFGPSDFAASRRAFEFSWKLLIGTGALLAYGLYRGWYKEDEE